MMHIVFQEADVAVLNAALKLDETFTGDVILVRDDFAVGPLNNIDSTEGMEERKNWWAKLLQYSPYITSLETLNDQQTVSALQAFATAAPAHEIWIWLAPNVHDQCSYYWLICQLADILPKVKIINIGNLPFINEKGNIFYPTALHEIRPSEFLKARRLQKTLTPGALEMLKDEWKKLCDTEDLVRIIEHDKNVIGKPVTYFDKKIIAALTKEAQKLPKFLQQLLTKAQIKTGDVFLVWRIREMGMEGLIEISGNWEQGWKEIMVRQPDKEIVEPQTAQTDLA